MNGEGNGSRGQQDSVELHEIRIQGHLEERWAGDVVGLTVTHETDGTTTLVAPLADQAALHGFIARMRDLNVPIISIRRIDIATEPGATIKVCIVGASGKLGQYMVQHALDRGYEVVAVCREASVGKLDGFKGRITVIPGATDDREVIQRAVAGCDAVLTVLVPRGVHKYASGTAQAVLDYAPAGARLIFSCGWHITRDGQDVYSRRLKALVTIGGGLARLVGFVDLDDQVEACRRVFASNTLWTVARGSDLEEGESQGLPVWSRHVGDPILKSNSTRRVDFALFMVEAIEDETLIQEAPAIVGCQTPSALAYSAHIAARSR